MTIVLKRRSGDWQAFVKEQPGVWECAPTGAAALGLLVHRLCDEGLIDGLKLEVKR